MRDLRFGDATMHQQDGARTPRGQRRGTCAEGGGAPLHADYLRTTRIRERAYQLWEACGRPPGRDAELWFQAEQEISQLD